MKLKRICIVILIVLAIFSIQVHAATDLGSLLTKTEYSDEYKAWLELSDEEKKEVMQPKKYKQTIKKNDIQNVKRMNNLVRTMGFLKASTDSKYNLKDVIPENVVVRNQMNTPCCWTFASLGALESNLAMRDKVNSVATPKTYDFSERHMQYATIEKGFLNDKVNDFGYIRELNEGGNFYMATSYLVNGSGAIPESEMMFQNNIDKIDIAEIKNKTISTTLYGTRDFPVPTTDAEKQQVMAEMKSHIQKNGGIFAGVHGDKLVGEDPYNNYNNATGAIYCSDETLTPIDHAVLIVGWDDTFSKTKFNSKNQPANDGAWIIKNSWGSEIEESLTELKKGMYDANTDECNQKGWDSAEKIPNEFIMQVLSAIWGEGKVEIQGDIIKVTIGEQGFMYISYDDVNIYSSLFAITKATPQKDYENIYQNDTLGISNAVYVESNEKLYLANVFNRTTSQTEYINRISVELFFDDEYKVYINPNGNSKAVEDLQQVELASGSTAKCNAGYTSIEFANPIKVTGDSFVIVLESLNTGSTKNISLESKEDIFENGSYKNVVANAGESYFSVGSNFQQNRWADFVTDTDYPGNLCIKAYTTKEVAETVTLDSIEISNAPNKTTYIEGENFDKTGMEVVAKYSNGTSKEITNYTITDGNNLVLGKTNVTISYTENGITKTATQTITVNKEIPSTATITKIEIVTNPTKTEYIKDEEELDLTGGIIKATYSDGSEEKVDMRNSTVTVVGFDNSTVGTKTITVTYKEKTTNFTVEVIEKTENKKEPVASDFDEAGATITDAEIRIYTTNIDNSYTKMKIEVSNVKIGDEDDTYTYYYYLSGTQGDNNIADSSWKKAEAEKQSDGTYTIITDMDTRELENLEEISDSENMYIYIKEIAEINDKTVETINSLELQNESDPLIYLNDNKIGSIEELFDKIQGDKKDPTTAPGELPQTGLVPIILTIIFIVAIAGFSLWRYKNIDK